MCRRLGSRFLLLRLGIGKSNSLLETPSSIIVRFFSSTVSNANQFTVDYLVTSCGLSPDSALKTSQRFVLNPKTTTKSDSVVSLFKTYGFTQPQISKLITGCPRLLSINPEKILKPKLDFFNSIGISGPVLGKILSKAINCLSLSLGKQIIPSINFLRTLGLSDSSIAYTLNRGGRFLHNMESKMVPNIAILRDHGVPKSNIIKFLRLRPGGLIRDSEKFNNFVLQLMELGVDPSSVWFSHCLDVLISIKKPRWDANMAMYMSFGWSEEEVLSMFRRQPQIMAKSTEKINSALDFFMNSLKWNRDYFVKYPAVVAYSLEKRVIPRCYVIQMLTANGLINKPNIGPSLTISEKVFLQKFVIKYQKEFPDLLNAFSRKISAKEIKIWSKDDFKIKTV